MIVPVKNEAENLRRCLPALAWADEVIVVDSQSTDETARVAAEHGASVVQFHFNGTYPKKKNWALDNLPFRNEWVLIVDADEVVVPELAEEIARRTAADEADGFYLNMKYFFLGRRIRHCGYAEAWNLRLFKHKLGRYERMPVEPPAPRPATTRPTSTSSWRDASSGWPTSSTTTPIPRSPSGSRSTTDTPSGRPRCTSGSSASRSPPRSGTGKRFKRLLKKVYLRLPMRPLVRFAYSYVIRLGFLDGRPGLVFCTLLAFYDFLAWANVYEASLRDQGSGEVEARPSTRLVPGPAS